MMSFMQKKEALIVLGDQLFPPKDFAAFKGMKVFMAEDRELCTHFLYHKQKITLFLSSMRHFRDDRAKDLEISYFDLLSPGTFLERLQHFIEKNKIAVLHHFEIEDKFFESRVKAWAEDRGLLLQEHQSPGFLSRRGDFKEYLGKTKKPFQKTFYEWQRKNKKILLTKAGSPEGGSWSHDSKNRKAYRQKNSPPKLVWTEPDRVTREVIELVLKEFTLHPGDLEEFKFPVTRSGALAWLDSFMRDRLKDFGPYEDAIHSEHPFLFHSLLSPLLNLGLLTPVEVIERAIQEFEKKKAPIESVEGFVRQILGWREFIRGIYRNFSEVQESKNFWGHHRCLNKTWYEGTTGIPPLDDGILKVIRFGYAHHIERLMIFSNLMLLCEIEPRQAHRWFMEMFIDSADWVMGPNVYGIGLFSDGGIFATKPYICGSNYLLKMSNYPRGEWCDTVDALYWSFIGKHKDFFTRNPRLSMMAKMLEKKTPAQIKSYNKIAKDFFARVTES